MITDILMAFVIALLLEMLSFNKYIKPIAISMCCLTIIFIYFINGCQLDFAGTIDLAIWIIFVIMFDIVLMFVGKKIESHIKE